MKYDRRNKINILQRSSGHDDYGEPIDSWMSYKTDVWASKMPLLGNEYFSAVATGSKVEVKFECSYFDGVTNTMRVQHDNEIYEILSAINVKGLNRDLLMYCRLVT